MLKYNVLVTCMGGYGALNLAEDIKNSNIGKQVEIVGTHADPYLLVRSSAERNYLMPWADSEKEYIESTKRLIDKENIDLLIPKSDKEVGLVSKHRDTLSCKLFLPEHNEIMSAQDKYSFYKIMKKYSIDVAETYDINTFDDVYNAIERLPRTQRYWIRVKTAGLAGAVAATWVENADQAKAWISLWQDMNGTQLSEFTISEFLPGRLFECLLLYKNGKIKVAKVYENLRYYGAAQRISGMSSTPEIAKTANDEKAIAAINAAKAATEAIADYAGTKSNGVYHLSAKENKDGRLCVTETNIGRFPSTSSFFNRTGKHNTAELYVRYGLDLPESNPDNIYDVVDKEIYMIRSLDKELSLIIKDEIDSCKSI